MKKTTILRGVVFALSLFLMLFAGGRLYGIYAEYDEGTQAYEKLAQQHVVTVPEGVQEYAPEAEKEGFSVNFESLLAEYTDVTAWIRCEGTPINYPIAQSEDNSYYLRRLLNGKYNIAGTIFMDYRNGGNFSDWNTVVYGHNMKNGSMFGVLPKYKEQSFYDAHPSMRLLTPDKEFEIELLGGYVTPADSEAYRFPASQEERDALIAYAREHSDFVSEVEVLEDDKLITLSTCVYDYEDARYVVVGVLRESESR